MNPINAPGQPGTYFQQDPVFSTGGAREAHKIILPILWVFLIDIGFLLVVYKHRRWAFVANFLLETFIIVATLAFSIPLMAQHGLTAGSNTLTFHLRFGFALLIFAVLLGVVGAVARLYRRRELSRSLYVHFFEKLHTYSVLVVAVLCKLQVLVMLRKTFYELIAFAAWEQLVLGLILYKKYLASTLERVLTNTYADEELKQRCDGEALIRVGSREEMRAIIKDKTHYAYFANCCYCLSPIKAMHPAGYQVIRSVEGRDLERYLFGMLPAEGLTEVPLHSHSENSLQILGLPIAKIYIPPPYSSGFSS